jgi:hypothetical protein
LPSEGLRRTLEQTKAYAFLRGLQDIALKASGKANALRNLLRKRNAPLRVMSHGHGGNQARKLRIGKDMVLDFLCGFCPAHVVHVYLNSV